jgi:GTPase involved in cell partitioning and DNA repair
MKKIGFILVFVLICSTVTFAQSTNDYKSRNHKLGKHKKSIKQKEKYVAVSEVESQEHNYKHHNRKFHRESGDTGLYYKRDKVHYNYKAYNRKLAKGQMTKKARIIDKNLILTKKR